MYNYTNDLMKIKDYATHGWDISADQYCTVLEACRYHSAWDETGKLARDIMYVLR